MDREHKNPIMKHGFRQKTRKLELCSAFADHLLYDVDSPAETCCLKADALVARQKFLETKRAIKIWAPNRNSIVRNWSGLLQNRGLSS